MEPTQIDIGMFVGDVEPILAACARPLRLGEGYSNAERTSFIKWALDGAAYKYGKDDAYACASGDPATKWKGTRPGTATASAAAGSAVYASRADPTNRLPNVDLAGTTYRPGCSA